MVRDNIKKSKGIFLFLAIVVCSVLFTSLYSSDKLTDPFFSAKHIAGMLISTCSIFLIVIYYLRKKYALSYKVNFLDLSILLYTLIAIIRFSFTGELFFNSTSLLNLLACTVSYFLLLPLIKNVKEQDRDHFLNLIYNIIALLAIVQALYGILQYFDIISQLQKDFKIGGAYGNPGPYANFLVCLLPITLFRSVVLKKGYVKNLNIVASILIIIIVALSQARTAWVATAIIMLIAIFLTQRGSRFIKKALSTKALRVISVLLVSIVVFVSIVGLLSFKKDSASGRLFIWKVSTEMIKEKPLFGHGFDSFAPVHNNYQAEYFRNNPNDTENAYIADSVTFAFNEFVYAATELGILGLLSFVSIFILSVYYYFKNKSKCINRHIGLGIIISFGVASLFSYPMKSISTIYIWFFGVALISSFNITSDYTVNMPVRIRRIFGYIGLILLVLWFKVSLDRQKGEFEWKEAYLYVRENKNETAVDKYRQLEEVMYYNPYFSFNYGAELLVLGRHKESIEILEKTKPRLCDADLMIYLGAAYEGLGDVDNAISHFEHASNMMPIKYLPKYRLMFLYDSKGMKKEALELAKNTLAMPVKVESPIVISIRQDIQKYIDNANSQN